MLAGRYNPTQTLLPYVPGYDKYFWDKIILYPRAAREAWRTRI
jgi:hypothetical protein